MVANTDRVEGGGGGGLKEDLWQTKLWTLFTPHLSFTSGNATDCTVSKLDTYVEARNTIIIRPLLHISSLFLHYNLFDFND